MSGDISIFDEFGECCALNFIPEYFGNSVRDNKL